MIAGRKIRIHQISSLPTNSRRNLLRFESCFTLLLRKILVHPHLFNVQGFWLQAIRAGAPTDKSVESFRDIVLTRENAVS